MVSGLNLRILAGHFKVLLILASSYKILGLVPSLAPRSDVEVDSNLCFEEDVERCFVVPVMCYMLW